MFTEVLCPRCSTLVMKIANGIAQGKCSNCKTVTTAGVDVKGDLHILVASKPAGRPVLVR